MSKKNVVLWVTASGVGLVLMTAGAFVAIHVAQYVVATYYSAQGHARLLKGDVNGAICDCNRAIEFNPTYADAYFYRAFANGKKGDYDGAMADYDRVIELRPNDDTAHFNRGYARNMKGNLDGAIADYGRVIALNSKYAPAYFNRALAKNKKGDCDGAIADLSRAIELDPKDAEAYRIRGGAKTKKDDWDDAMADYNRAIELNPKSLVTYISRGNARLMKGDFADAVTDLNRVLESDSNNSFALYYRGGAYFMEHRWAEAMADFRRVCELKKREPEYPRLYIWLIRVQLGQRDAASPELAAHFETLGGNPAKEWPVKVASFLLDKINESDLIDAAVSPDATKQQGQNSDAWFFAGMKRLLAGDKIGAADSFRKCLALNSKNCSEYYCAQAELKALGQ